MPANAISAPTIWAGRGRSLSVTPAKMMVKKTCNWMTSELSPTGKPSRMATNSSAELADADGEAIEDDEPRRGPGRPHEQDQRHGGEQEAQRRERKRRRRPDADLDGDEGEAPDDRDGDRGQDVARAHGVKRVAA